MWILLEPSGPFNAFVFHSQALKMANVVDKYTWIFTFSLKYIHLYVVALVKISYHVTNFLFSFSIYEVAY